MQGKGFVFQPTRRGRKLGVWYYSIRVGRRLKTATGFRSKAEATEALREERRRIARGVVVKPAEERLLIEDVLSSYETDRQNAGAKSRRSIACRVRLLKEQFGHVRAIELDTKQVETFREQRLAAGKNRATIDREVETLRAALNFARRCGRISQLPYLPMFGTDNVRKGFFEAEQADAVEAALVAAGQPVVAEVFRFVRFTGWRISEVLALCWEWVDRAAGEIRLPDSKNGEGRTIALDGVLAELVARRWAAREYRTVAGPALSTFVFHQRAGRPVSYAAYRRAFSTAAAAASVSLSTHDLRRTTARDLRRAGVSETVCMSVTGHKTAAMFRRYSITDVRDQREAFAARDALLKREAAESFAVRLRVRREG